MSSDVLAVAALAISLATFVVNQRWNHRAERRARMPVLVFRDRDEAGVTVVNIGQAPAMNIIFAQGRPVESHRRSIDLDARGREEWFNPLHLRPLEPNAAAEDIPCCPHYDLGLRYTDVFDAVYVVRASDFGMRILEGARHLPDWNMTDDAKYVDELSRGERDGLRIGTPEARWAVRPR